MSPVWRYHDASACRNAIERAELRAAEAERQAAEANQRAVQANRRFTDLADSLPVFVWTATPQGIVDYCGAPFAAYAGVSCEVVSSPDWWLAFVHDDDRERVLEIWGESVTKGTPYATDFRIRRHDGVYHWFWVSARPVRGEDGQILIWYGCMADIEEQRSLQRESAELAQRLSATLASIQDPFFTVDEAGRISAINDQAREIFAQGRDIVGEPAWKAMEGLGRTRVALECRIAIAQQRVVRFESCLAPQGRWYSISIFPSQSGLTVMLRDVDTRMRDELLHTAEARVLGMIAAEAPLDEILEHTVLGIEAAIPTMTGSILLYDQDSCTLHHGAAPGLPEPYRRAIDGAKAGPMAGSCGTAAWTGEAVFVEDIETDPRWITYRDLALPYGFKSCWSMPVLSADAKVMATFAMYYREPRLPNGDDVALIQRTANLVSIAITRNKEQQALRASEEQFRGLFRSSATGMAIATPDGHFVDANSAYCRMVGYSVEELRSRDFLSITHEDDRQENARLYAELLDGRSDSYVFEKRYRAKGGRTVWARVTTTMQRESAQPLRLLSVAEDITVRHLAEEVLDLQSALLTMAARLGKLGGWMVEASSGKLFWSDEVRSILEAPQDYEPALDKDIPTLYTSEYRDVVACAVRDCLERGTPIDLQADIFTMKGSLLRVHILGEAVRDPSGAIVRVQGAFQNITEYYRLVQRLADSEARFREIAENIRDVFWVRSAAGSIKYVSPGYERIWGRPCSELYARPLSWTESLHPDDRSRVLEAVTDVSHDYCAEYRIVDANGSERWIVDAGFPVRDVDGSVLRVTGVARDITERKRAEQDLRQALEQLARTNRELEDFAYVASHDLQEPLRKIKVFSDRLTERTQALGSQERDYLERMSSAADRMQNLIADLLGYSRVATRAQPMRPVRLDVLLDQVLVDLELSITESGARVERRPLPTVIGDSVQLQQLMQNLIGNALKFRKAEVPSLVRVYACHEAGHVCLCVADNGIGIEHEHLERIFRPFQRLHGRSEYPGSGIGLAIVKKIADRHSATISVRSKLGEGTEFRVCFMPATLEAVE